MTVGEVVALLVEEALACSGRVVVSGGRFEHPARASSDSVPMACRTALMARTPRFLVSTPKRRSSGHFVGLPTLDPPRATADHRFLEPVAHVLPLLSVNAERIWRS